MLIETKAGNKPLFGGGLLRKKKAAATASSLYTFRAIFGDPTDPMAVDTGSTALTYTRAGNQTGININVEADEGHMFTKGANVGVIQCPDSTKTSAEGLLLEYSKTNYVIRSREFDNGVAWVPGNITVTANVVDGADDTAVADRLVSTAPNATLDQTTNLNAVSITVIFSVWLRADSGTFNNTNVVLEVESNAGAAETASALLDADTGTNATVGTTWKRCYVLTTFTGAATGKVVCRIKMITDALTIYADCAQLDNASGSKCPYSFVETAAATATSQNTTCYLNTSEFSTSKTSFMMHVYFPFANGNANSPRFLGGTANFGAGSVGWWTGLTSVNRLFFYLNGVLTQGAILETWNHGTWHNICFTWDFDSDSYQGYFDGNNRINDVVAKACTSWDGIYLSDDAAVYGMPFLMSELRIYKGKILTPGEITSEITDIETSLGL